jgi:hypothetical protein
MTWKTLLAAGLFGTAALGLGASEAYGVDGMRCKQRLITKGDPMYVVEQRCGPPDAVTTRIERRRVWRTVTVPCGTGLCQRTIEDEIQVPIEEWTYDFGKQRFIQFVHFVAGKVEGVTSGGYGYKDM